jgi:hypothetical protein
MSMTLSNEKKAWMLYQFQAATFCQVENWEALYEIERLIEGEGGVYEVVERYSELAHDFSHRSLDEEDLELFLRGLRFCDGRKQNFEAVLMNPEAKLELLMQLRKMNWTDQEIRRIALKVTHVIETNLDSIRSLFYTFAECAQSGDEITMEDLNDFMIETRFRTKVSNSIRPGDNSIISGLPVTRK